MAHPSSIVRNLASWRHVRSSSEKSSRAQIGAASYIGDDVTDVGGKDNMSLIFSSAPGTVI
jgi:hypothetical protein